MCWTVRRDGAETSGLIESIIAIAGPKAPAVPVRAAPVLACTGLDRRERGSSRSRSVPEDVLRAACAPNLLASEEEAMPQPRVPREAQKVSHTGSWA